VKKLLFGLLGFLVILILIGIVGCAGGEPGQSWPQETGGIVMTQPTATKVTTPTPTITAVPPTTTTVVAPSAPDMEDGVVVYGTSATTDRMVIRTAYLTIVVANTSAAMQQITSIAESYGGFVVNSNISGDNNRLYAYISFRVESSHFNDTLQALHAMAADVKSESTTGEDVTEQYTDLESRLRNLEASEAQLLELMNQAGTVAEILSVQRELTNTREDIELIKGQMQYLEQSAAMSLFTVTLEQSKLFVEFVAETRTAKEGQAIQFYADVSGGFSPYTYEWDFGDGETSTEANPSHVYHAGETFTVTLKVTDDKGTTETYEREDYITVLPGWSAGGVAEGAWNAFVSFFRAIGSFFIGLGIWSPLWIAILLILYFAWWRRRKKNV
jgi:hypothetical protein